MRLARPVQDAIWSLDKDQTITSVATFDDLMGAAVARPRFLTVLLGLFGVLGLMLGVLGLYGVLAYLVNHRQREIGVRIALGARPADVVRMVVKRGLTLTLSGVVVGLAGAFVLTRFMRGVLFDVAPSDPSTFILVTLALIGVAAAASYIPARRATRVDPAMALRAE
jgi:ABC-type antimicrobial peptide transport system permease subunit